MKQTTGFTNSARFRCLEDLQKDSVDLCLIYCGWEDCDPGHRFGPNLRASHLLHIVKKGKGKLEINNKIYNMKEGDAFFIPPHMEAWYEADKEDPWTYLWLGYTGIRAKECTESMGFSVNNPVRHLDCLELVNQNVECILEAPQLSYENELRRNALLMLTFAEVIQEYKKGLPGGGNTDYVYPGSVYVKHAVEYISFNYGSRIKINELADYIGVNRSYLTSSFKKIMGCSPQEYLINLRIEKAKSLLKNTGMAISEVAACVGYADQLAFSKIFKQYLGQSPRAYRDAEEELIITMKKGDYENTRPV